MELGEEAFRGGVDEEGAFRLVNGDKEVLATGGDGDLKTAIRALYGAQVADALLPVALDYQGVKVSGFVFENRRCARFL